MNGIELVCFREELGLSLEEFAQMIEMEASELSREEKNHTKINESLLDDVDQVNEVLDNLVEDSIEELEKSFSKKKPEEVSLVVYPDNALFQKYNHEIFELIPSSRAHRLALWQVKLEVEENTGINISLVRFDEEEYKSWLQHNKLNHTVPQVAKWAAQL